MNEYQSGGNCRNDAVDFKNLRVSSPEELKHRIRESLLQNNGGLFIVSAVSFNLPVDGVCLAERKHAFGFHFNKKVPEDTKELIEGLEKAIICKRLLGTLLFRKQTYNIDFRVDVSVPIFSNDYVLRHDAYTGVYQMKMPSDNGSAVSNAKAFSEFVMGYFLYNNSVLRARCTTEKYKEYVERFVSLYSLGGEISMEQLVDELRLVRNQEDWNRLEARKSRMYTYQFNDEAAKLNGVYLELCRKYRNQDNYLGKWADRFYRDNPFLF